MGKSELEKAIKETERSMQRAAKEMEFIEAARYRDQIEQLKQQLKKFK
jgi:excinuclease ABC subunit B